MLFTQAQEDHPLTNAQRALQQMLIRLNAWQKRDAETGGRQAPKIDSRSVELLAILKLTQYTMKLEDIIRELDAKVEASWMAGYSHRILEATEREQQMIARVLRLMNEKDHLIEVLEREGIHVFLPAGTNQAA